jgi:hypothetical protein
MSPTHILFSRKILRRKLLQRNNLLCLGNSYVFGFFPLFSLFLSFSHSLSMFIIKTYSNPTKNLAINAILEVMADMIRGFQAPLTNVQKRLFHHVLLPLHRPNKVPFIVPVLPVCFLLLLFVLHILSLSLRFYFYLHSIPTLLCQLQYPTSLPFPSYHIPPISLLSFSLKIFFFSDVT